MAKHAKKPESTSPQMIVGLNITVEDDNTGAPASYHVISRLWMDFTEGVGYATLESYYNQTQYEAGKQPIGAVQFDLRGKPPRGMDAFDWAYRSIASAPPPEDTSDAENLPLTPNRFAGAELVWADVPPDQAATAAAESLPEDDPEDDTDDENDGE